MLQSRSLFMQLVILLLAGAGSLTVAVVVRDVEQCAC